MSSEHLLRPTPDQLRALAKATEARDVAEARAGAIRSNPGAYVQAMNLNFNQMLRNLNTADSPLVAKIHRLVGEHLGSFVEKALLEFMDEENAARQAAGLVRLGRPEDIDPRHPPDDIIKTDPLGRTSM